MTLRKMMIPTMTMAIKRKSRKPKATAVTLTHYDNLWRWWGCLAHSGVSRHRLSGRCAAMPFVAGWRAT